MLKLSLIGKNISHSLSEKTYQRILNQGFSYELLDYENESEIPALSDLLSRYRGISITAPYKKFVYDRCLSSSRFKNVEAINCIRLKGGEVIGTNTDYDAIKMIFSEKYLSQKKKIVLLGDGAMARVILDIFSQMNISSTTLSRRNDRLHTLMEFDVNEFLIINTCAREFDLGMYKLRNCYLWDLNYKMNYTKAFEERLGEKFQSGEKLLLEQAKLAAKFWGIN